ncbi:retrovirus-related Pol polyprotein from transposon 17.6 [Trichonephila clavipes]|nr:retrovirus-related Pol polyprotein from transposon 17.6 [Trichonephila clavipes]
MASDEASDQEGASMQLIPARPKVSTELYIDTIGPLHIVPIRDKYILPDMCMSPRCHEAVPVPEALPQIFRMVFPREIQADRDALIMSILTTELLRKLGTYCPLRVPFRLKNAFYCFSMLMAQPPQGHEKFDLSYFDNVVVFSEGCGFPIDHMDGILELNTHLAVRPTEFELAQDGVEYCSHVVGLGKKSPAQLKVRAIIDFSISRYKTQVKVWEYDRQYIPMFSRLVTPVTEMLKRKSKKGDIKWTSECPELFRQLEGNLSTNSVLYAPDFTKRFIFQPETILFIYFVCRS